MNNEIRKHSGPYFNILYILRIVRLGRIYWISNMKRKAFLTAVTLSICLIADQYND